MRPQTVNDTWLYISMHVMHNTNPISSDVVSNRVACKRSMFVSKSSHLLLPSWWITHHIPPNQDQDMMEGFSHGKWMQCNSKYVCFSMQKSELSMLPWTSWCLLFRCACLPLWVAVVMKMSPRKRFRSIANWWNSFAKRIHSTSKYISFRIKNECMHSSF